MLELKFHALKYFPHLASCRNTPAVTELKPSLSRNVSTPFNQQIRNSNSIAALKNGTAYILKMNRAYWPVSLQQETYICPMYFLRHP